MKLFNYTHFFISNQFIKKQFLDGKLLSNFQEIAKQPCFTKQQ